jgi:hypothetical protein
MKVVIPCLALSYLVVVSTAAARDLKEAIRDQQAFCSQFVIHDPVPSVTLGYMRNCCAFSQNVHDCQMYDRGAIERW